MNQMRPVLLCSVAVCCAAGSTGCWSNEVPVVETGTSPTVSSALDTEQPGYRASLYATAWPVDMANLERSNAVYDAGLPEGFACADVRVDTVEMPFPVFAYTRDVDEVFVVGGLPRILEDYVAAVDGAGAGSTPNEPHLTRYNPQTGETHQLDLTAGSGFGYIGGALVHANGFVYVVSQSYLYKVDPDTMAIVGGRELPSAPFPGSLVTIYNGLSTSSSGHLLTKFFSGITDASTFLVIDADSLEILSSTDQDGASPRLTVSRREDGTEHLYHLNQVSTFRMRIEGSDLVLDEDWQARFDPYSTGETENEEPTSPVIVDGRVHYTTNTLTSATEPMRMFWQDADDSYSLSDPPLGGFEVRPGSGTPGWSFFHLSIDPDTSTIIAVDQGSKALVAMRVSSGQVEYLWERPYTVSARPAIVADRGYVYATDYVDGRNDLVILAIGSGEELCRIRTPATRPTIATIVVSAANEVYFGSNEPGEPIGLFHRVYIP